MMIINPTPYTGEIIKHYIADQSWVAAHQLQPTNGGIRFDQFEELFMQQPKDQAYMIFGGRKIICPRKTQSYLIDYTFSGQTSKAVRKLPDIVGKLFNFAKTTNAELNQCLINWYENWGYIGYHADDERQLKPNSEIYSFTFGPANRSFLLKPKRNEDDHVKIPLQHNVLVIMGGACQSTHKHSVPKVNRTELDGRRLNVTFRSFQ